MSSHERLYRRLLIAYPKSYRLQRGDEIVTTISDQEDARGGGVRVGDLLNVIFQGIMARLRGARPVTATLSAAALALVIALAVQLASSPSYAAVGAVRALPGATQRSVASELGSPIVLKEATRLLHGVVPKCTVSHVTPKAVDLTCQGNHSATAVAMVHMTLFALFRVDQARITHGVVTAMQSLFIESAQLNARIELARTAMKGEDTHSAAYVGHHQLLQRLESTMTSIHQRQETLASMLFGNNHHVTFVGISSAHLLSSIEVSELLVAALIGAVIGLLTSLLLRRRLAEMAIRQP